MEDKEKFNDDLNQDNKINKEESSEGINRNDLATKWNEIQEEYIAKYKELDTQDLYFEGGGFTGMLNKMAEILGKSTDQIRTEIENW